MLKLTFVVPFLVCVHGAVLQPVSMVDGRIVGGTQGDINSSPYLVSLLYDEFLSENFKHICGGTIISIDVILTAANCTDGRAQRPEQYRTRAGSNFHNFGGEIDRVSRIVQHERYSVDGNQDYDISLVYLANRLVLGPNIAVINLPNQDQIILDNTYVTVSGWGLDNNLKPDRFNVASVRTFNHDQCVAILSDINPVTDNMICTIAPQIRGSSNGDEGGPLVLGYKLIGITSWSYRNVRNGNTQYFGVFTKVSKFIDWIDQNM